MSATITPSQRRKAAQMLLVATVFWAVSFPTMKALGMMQERLLTNASSWFVTAVSIIVRFGVASILMLPWSWRTLRGMTWLEFWQGLGLGLFGGLGLLFQMDGLAYTAASTSAFLTQCYCLIIPVVVAIRERRWPPPVIVVCSIMVVIGVGILSGLDWHDLRLGRGELETLIGSVLFTAQILWLERPLFAANRVGNFTIVMFLVIALSALPVAVATTGQASDWGRFLWSPMVLGLMSILILFCTMVGYVMMNLWQRFVPASEAGLIYCAEPLFASGFALFLPAWFSAWAGFDYPNETITRSLILGGGLITAANVILQVRSLPSAAPAPAGAGADTP